MDVIGVSPFMYSMLVLVGMICTMIGALIYKACFRATDTRLVVFFGQIIGIIGAFFSYVQAKRWNLEIGIDDITYLFFTDVVFNIVMIMLIALPLMGLIAKLIPKRIEGSTYALLTSVDSFSMLILRPALGTWINH